jgi:hypothetical protein
MEKMFEAALKNKFRFPFKGMVNTEDLFDLSVRDLDTIFKTLNTEVKKVKEESLLTTKSKEDTELEFKIEIVKYIFAEKVKEQEERKLAKENAEKKQKIMELINNKQEADLANKSIDELKSMLNSL